MINFSNRCYHACVRSALNCSRRLDSGSKGRQSGRGMNRLKRCGVWCGCVCVYTYMCTLMCTHLRAQHLRVPTQSRAGGSQSARKGFVGQECLLLAAELYDKKRRLTKCRALYLRCYAGRLHSFFVKGKEKTPKLRVATETSFIGETTIKG